VKGATEVLPFLLIDLVVIIAAARSFGALAKRIGQPAVIGEIVAGILLGPTVLGRFFPGLPAELFPKEVPLRPLADLGLVFFMFLVGLELDPRLIRKEGRRALSISLSGVIAPFTLGVLIGVPLLALNNGGVFAEGVTRPPTGLAFSLFLGAAMCITAFPVLARILVERGLYKSPLGTTALCAAAVDDVTAWILLAAVVGITRTGSAAQAANTFMLAAAFAVVMVTAGRRLLALLAKRFAATGHLTVDLVSVVIVGLLLSAYFTERIGIHSIFGAFVFGTIMPRESRMTHELTDKIEDFTAVVLLPVFFVVTGLRTNLFSIDSPGLVVWMFLIIATAIVGKLAGCGLAAKINGYSTRDSLTLGTLMNTRGLTELVILTIGLSLGVLSDRTFAIMVVMALVTTFMAAPIVNRLMPRREMVRVLSGGDPEPMARRVLVALGNPDNARALIDAGIRLIGTERPSELLLARMIPTARAPEFRSGLRDEESQVDRSVEAMSALAHQAAEAGLTARVVSFLSEDVARDLAYIADSQRCETVLLGWHRASLDREVVRALVHRVFALAPCDVIVFVDRLGRGVPPGTGRPVTIAFAHDDDRAVLEIGRRLADSLQTTVQRVGRSGAGQGDEALNAAVHESASSSAAVVAVGTPWTKEAEFGQPATRFAGAATCPVLVIRPAPGPPAHALSAGSSAATAS
jgi:Kef-type K+ transport system membrane component KefB